MYICNITATTLAVFFRTLPGVASMRRENESNEESTRTQRATRRTLMKSLENHGLRRLGVPGLELNAEPILYGVDVPLLILGSLDSPK